MRRSTTELTRRDMLKAGLLAGVGIATARLALHADTYAQQGLLTKPIPSTGEQLPIIGIGTNRFSTSPPDLVARLDAVMRRMPELGMRVIDTANGYGGGNSERVIGNVTSAAGIRDRLFLATKANAGNRDAAAARAMVEQSFASLKTDRIDLYFVHNMGGTDILLGVLREYKQQGRIKYIGCSISSDNNYAPLQAVMRREQMDFIEIDYSITNTNAEEDMLALARERGMAVLNNVPFNSRGGQLITQMEGKPLPPFVAELGVTSWAQYFLKYNVSHPAITCAIPGTTRVEHLEDNVQAARGTLPDEATRKRMLDYFNSVAG